MRTLNESDLNWCVRRMPVQVRELLSNSRGRVFLAGGFIRSCIANEPVSDIDLFTASIAEAKAQAVVLACGSEVHTTENAYTISIDGLPIQFIHRWTFECVEDCVKSFDFTIARAAVWFSTNKWQSVCDDRFYEDLAAKRLVYCSPIRNEDAGGSMLRVLKFYQRGYRIPLDSLAAVIARLNAGIRDNPGPRASESPEQFQARIITGLLHEVDPSVNPDQTSYLPSSQQRVEGSD